MDDDGVYEDTGTSGQLPQNDSSRPEGSGVGSFSAAGGNKQDTVSAGPNLGNTIAGRTNQVATQPNLPGAGAGEETARNEPDEANTSGEPMGGPSTGGAGVMGHHGRSDAAAHETPSTRLESEDDETAIVS